MARKLPFLEKVIFLQLNAIGRRGIDPIGALRMSQKCLDPPTEARIVTELARKQKLVTQIGTQIHAGGNYRRVVELVRSGVIGEVREDRGQREGRGHQPEAGGDVVDGLDGEGRKEEGQGRNRGGGAHPRRPRRWPRAWAARRRG